MMSANELWSQTVGLLHLLDRHNGLLTAAATLVVAIFTVVLAWVTGRQAKLTKQAVELTRQDFLSAHRPQLRVKAFRLTRGVQARDNQRVGRVEYGGSVLSQLQGPLVVEFTVVNVGKSTAHLLRSSVGIQFPTRVQLPENPGRLPDLPYRGADVTGSRKFGPGASDSYNITGEAAPLGQNNLMVYGDLVYTDAAGDTRSTAFCRTWDATRNRFVAVDDPDYEYED
jgi:hypothetical protein